MSCYDTNKFGTPVLQCRTNGIVTYVNIFKLVDIFEELASYFHVLDW